MPKILTKMHRKESFKEILKRKRSIKYQKRKYTFGKSLKTNPTYEKEHFILRGNGSNAIFWNGTG
jgi:hypothetical protein